MLLAVRSGGGRRLVIVGSLAGQFYEIAINDLSQIHVFCEVASADKGG